VADEAKCSVSAAATSSCRNDDKLFTCTVFSAAMAAVGANFRKNRRPSYTVFKKTSLI